MAYTITLVCDDVEDLFDTMVRLAGPKSEYDEKLNAIAAQVNGLNAKLDLILNADNLPRPAPMPKPPKPTKSTEK